jgi:hypothetical protein
MSQKSFSTPSRLTGFTANSLWHRRLSRLHPGSAAALPARVQPRVSAELILHPVVSQRLPLTPLSAPSSRDSLDVCHAA